MKGKYFWCVAGDNPINSETCITLLSYIGKFDLIIPCVIYIGRSLHRRTLSFLYAFLVRMLAGVNIRYFNGSSIFIREHFVEQMKKIRGFSYSAEILITLLKEGYTYTEVCVTYNERTHGHSSALTYSNFIEVANFFWRIFLKRFYHFRSLRLLRSLFTIN